MPAMPFTANPVHVRRLIEGALDAADPARLVERSIDAARAPTRILAVGKAARGMMRGALGAMGSTRARAVRGIVIEPGGRDQSPADDRIQVFTVDHPLPTVRNIRATEAARKMVQCLTAEDHLLCLISGGASAALTLPAEGLSLDHIAGVTDALLRAGASIDELNTVRKHCERLKGGRLASLASPARITALLISDVIGDRPDVIASGPVSPDPTTCADAIAVLSAHGLIEQCPAVAHHVGLGAAGQIDETPKPGDPVFDRVRTRIIASNATALARCRRVAQEMGLGVLGWEEGVTGSADALGRRIGRLARAMPSMGEPPSCWIVGGETAVALGSATGSGGPCQEIALAAAIELDGTDNVAVAAFSTDGVDGPTDAAGAIATGHTARRAGTLGLDPRGALDRHDSHAFFDRVGGLIRTGATGTNVNDLVFVLAYPPSAAKGAG